MLRRRMIGRLKKGQKGEKTMPGKPILKWQIGDVTVSRVTEFEMDGFLEHIVSAATPEALDKIPWLKPHFVTDEGLMKWSVHALVIQTPTKKIVVDTCVGNDKQRDTIPFWNGMQTPFLETLEEAGFTRGSIDTVLCTHLHIDHIGWNTMLVEGKWVPTFPNARYLFGREEFAFWREETARAASDGFDSRWEFQAGVVADSVEPIVEAGLVDLVTTDHQICEEVRLIPTAGHTPGHVSVQITSNGQTALITGDFAHHPCQVAHPDWATTVDFDGTQSSDTRRRVFAQLAGKPTLVIGTHWAPPTAGRVVRDGDTYRLDF
jgi:glyoxylase-like metal-dependent hydrolase (beta-lactamase superfamily II)